MTRHQKSIGRLLTSLKERAKELNCLYAVEELANDPDADLRDVCRGIVEVIPPGWQYPDICQAEIMLDGERYRTAEFTETPWLQSATIVVQGRPVGGIRVVYQKEMPNEDEGPFLKEETRLIRTIAERLGHFILHQHMRKHFDEWESAKRNLEKPERGDWRIVLDLLEHTDRDLFAKLSHQMLNHLCWSGIKEAEELLEEADLYRKSEDDALFADSNVPSQKRGYSLPSALAQRTFQIASEHMSDDNILFRIQKWMQEERISFLVRAVETHLPLPEVADSIRRYQHLALNEDDLSKPVRTTLRVGLIRRFLSDQLPFLKIAKEYLRIGDFYDLLQYVIYGSDSQGKLGGKSAGLYLARRILETERANVPEIGDISIPKSWHVSADMQVSFMHYNNLDELAEHKYKPISQIRFEYPHIVHTLKNSRFPSDLLNGLSVALDDLGETPLIVRSSSVLEDRVGAAFSGKYKSLFLANQGTKKERIEALLDAVAEVYASMFGPDPIEYRTERGLLDFAEEMGILIQQVVGTRIGKYYLPLFAGVAFSRNEFRWSPRIRREDGLVRIVPGLGTRAVDRLSDDYPVMFAPGQPGLRVNVSEDEILRYSPRWLDAIDLEANTFTTVAAAELFAEHADSIPQLAKLVSIHDGGRFRRPSLADTRFDPADVLVTCEGLMSDKAFVGQMQAILRVLEEKIGEPVDVEFAHDGETLHILQCRAQSHAGDSSPVPIPRDIDPERLLFSAQKYVSNGQVSDITHIVYVDPERYAELPDRERLKEVGLAVGKLNKLLPKRQFILMGPGRWGSRGDIKLGVSVTYADINNTAALIEIARKKGNYTPDLSFGTHFFQDLVEARIRYLPLYPDEKGNAFNEEFLLHSPNILSEILPAFASVADTIRVIDVPSATGGLVVKLLMNADLEQAVAILSHPDLGAGVEASQRSSGPALTQSHWRWRQRMAEQLASSLDPQRYGARGMYVFGSTKNCTAGPESDIDILIHFVGSADQRELLLEWLDGWSTCLDEINFTRTGHRTGGLLDVHLLTDDDIANRTSYAVKIGAVTDAARPLPMKS